MSNYTGYRCPVCGKAFAPGDDVVVCPDCGTPHHRECYRSLGRCAQEDKHAAGEQWSPAPSPEDIPAAGGQATLLCPRCGSHNPAGNIFCQVCGHQLTAGQVPGQPVPPPPGPQQGYRPFGQEEAPRQDQGFGPGAAGCGDTPQWFRNIFPELGDDQELAPGVTNRDVCYYVGPNSFVFLLRFQRLLQPGFKISVNWSAFFFSFFYCFYRKMYKLGALLLAIVAGSMVPVFWAAYPLFAEIWAEYGTLTMDALYALSSPAAQQFASAAMLFRTVSLLVSLFCGFFFNSLYCRRACQEIRTVRETGHFSSGSPEYRYALAHRGGVNLNAVLVAVCTLMVFYIIGCVGLTYQLM